LFYYFSAPKNLAAKPASMMEDGRHARFPRGHKNLGDRNNCLQGAVLLQQVGHALWPDATDAGQHVE
jgi:hypothetical protein